MLHLFAVFSLKLKEFDVIEWCDFSFLYQISKIIIKQKI